jgi:hypothetical protein
LAEWVTWPPLEDSHSNLGGLQTDLSQDIGSSCASDLRGFDTTVEGEPLAEDIQSALEASPNSRDPINAWRLSGDVVKF